MLKVLTDIYPPHIKPVRDGEYLARAPGGVRWMILVFSNGWWRPFGTLSPCLDQYFAWRGLAFDPASAEQVVHYDGTDDDIGRDGVFLPGAEVV